MPNCSVIIPTYNRKESLKRTLDAFSRQTLAREAWELIVISDGSSDGTAAFLAEYAAIAPFTLRWFEQKNSGPAAARNKGIDSAEGEIIVFTDDDVEPIPQFLEKHLSHHDDEKIVVIGPLSPNPAWAKHEPVWIAWEHDRLQAMYAMFRPGGAYADAAPWTMHFYSGNASLRRKWLCEIGGFDVAFKRQEDVEMATRLARKCRLRFKIDMEADGLHHPVRTLRSWLKIPTAYGALDAERVLAGTLRAGYPQSMARERHRLTKLVTGVCRFVPPLIAPLTVAICAASIVAYKLGLRRIAFAALSCIYNARYEVAYAGVMAAKGHIEATASA